MQGRRCEREAQAVAQTGEYEESILTFEQVGEGKARRDSGVKSEKS